MSADKADTRFSRTTPAPRRGATAAVGVLVVSNRPSDRANYDPDELSGGQQPKALVLILETCARTQQMMP